MAALEPVVAVIVMYIPSAKTVHLPPWVSLTDSNIGLGLVQQFFLRSKYWYFANDISNLLQSHLNVVHSFYEPTGPDAKQKSHLRLVVSSVR